MKVTMKTKYNGLMIKEYAVMYGSVDICQTGTYYEGTDGKYVFVQTPTRNSAGALMTLAVKIGDEIKKNSDYANEIRLYHITWWKGEKEIPSVSFYDYDFLG